MIVTIILTLLIICSIIYLTKTLIKTYDLVDYLCDENIKLQELNVKLKEDKLKLQQKLKNYEKS